MRASRPESHATVMLWLALAVLLAYGNALLGPFQFDDYNVIVNEPVVHSWHDWLANLGHGIRPLLKLSYTLDWMLGGSPVVFHLTNLLIHFINSYLVFRLAQTFVWQRWQQYDLYPVPLLAALLFVLHPIHTEAVTYISGRSASLMTLFYLAALLSYVQGRLNHNRLALYVLTPLCFVLALAVKETAITLPLALLVWELCCGGRWQAGFKPQWPVWLLALLAALFFLLNSHYAAQMQRSANFNDLHGNFATQLSAFVWLLRQWFAPLWLNIDPDLPVLHHLSEAGWPLALFAVGFALMLPGWRHRPWLSFALAWAMVQLLPLYLLLPRIDIANERQMYLASWPLCLALAIELTLWLHGKTWRTTVAILLIALTSLTLLRNLDYSSEISLWEDTATKSPRKARVHNNLGYAYLQAAQFEAAQREFETALQLDPQLYQAHYNLQRTEEEMKKAGVSPRP